MTERARKAVLPSGPCHTSSTWHHKFLCPSALSLLKSLMWSDGRLQHLGRMKPGGRICLWQHTWAVTGESSWTSPRAADLEQDSPGLSVTSKIALWFAPGYVSPTRWEWYQKEEGVVNPETLPRLPLCISSWVDVRGCACKAASVNPMECSLQSSSVDGTSRARILPFPSAGDHPEPGMETETPASAGRFFHHLVPWPGIKPWPPALEAQS